MLASCSEKHVYEWFTLGIPASAPLAKAKENGVKFGRPTKVAPKKQQVIYDRRMARVTISQLAKEFNLGEASIYRVINAIKKLSRPIK